MGTPFITDKNRAVFEPYRDEDRAFLAKLWERYEPFADRNFLADMARTIHPRFWEMYLGYVLLDAGLPLVARKDRVGTAGPDCRVRWEGKTIWVEAIAPTRGGGADSVPEMTGDGQWRNVPDKQIILRYRHAIEEKKAKYAGYTEANIVAPTDPFVLAVSGGGIPNVRSEFFLPRIVQAVLPFGDYAVNVNRETFDVVGEGFQHRPGITKLSGTTIATTVFQDAAYMFISAVMFSYADIRNRPDNLGDDFVLCHNPLAAAPIPRGWLKRGREYWTEDAKLNVQDWRSHQKFPCIFRS